MKALILLIISIFIPSLNKSQVTQNLDIPCSSYVVMNRVTTEVIAGKNLELQRSVASISKVMTAIIAIESNHLFDVIEIDEKASKQEGSSLYLKPLEKISLLDLVYGLMLRSGNDAAYTIACYLEGSIDAFKDRMNLKAKELSMNNTYFNNPSGLDIDDDGNISTVYDMALLFSYAMSNSIFYEIVNTKEYRCLENKVWINKNKLIRSYEYCDGGKTGYTKKAKRTLVTGAKYDTTELCIVTFNCGGDFSYHKKLYEYYFANYKYIPFLVKGKNYIAGNEIYSDKNIGLFKKQEEIKGSCIKIYRIDTEGNLIELQLVINNKIIERIFL